MSFSKHNLVFRIVLWAQIAYSLDPGCPDEEVIYSSDGTNIPIKWSTSEVEERNHITSSPLCLSNYKYLLTRECDFNGQWIPALAPVCAFTQPAYVKSDKCPNGMFNVHGSSTKLLCIAVTEPDVWTNTCGRMGANKTILDLEENDRILLVIHLYSQWPQFQFWLPANIISPKSIRWMLPGRFGNIETLSSSMNHIGQPAFQGKGCALMSIINNVVVISSQNCKQIYPMLCVYAEESPLLQLACPTGYTTTRYKENQYSCFTTESRNIIETPHENMKLYKMTSVETTYLAQHILSDRIVPINEEARCLFDPFETNSETQLALGETIPRQLWESTSPNQVKYVNWLANREVDDENACLTTNSFASWSFETTANCLLVNQTIWPETPSINLSIVPGTNQLHLQVQNPNHIWRQSKNDIGVHCFHSKDIRKSYETAVHLTMIAESTAKIDTWTFLLEIKGPGLNWCEAYQIGSMNWIETLPVHIDQPDNFTGSVARQCPCLVGFLNMTEWILAALIESRLDNTIHVSDIEVVRWEHFRVATIDFIQIWFRLSVQIITGEYIDNLPENSKYVDPHIFQTWRKHGLLIEVLQIEPFYFPVVNSTKYCMPILETTSNSIVLMGGRINQIRTPSRMCVLQSGQPVLLRCDGNAEVGAAWSYITDSECFTEATNQVTEELFDITASFTLAIQTDDIFERVEELTDGHPITALDLFSISNIMNQAALLNEQMSLNKLATDKLFIIYDRVMSIDVSITRESSKLNTTNILLASFEAMVNNMASNEDNERKNFQTHVIDPGTTDITGFAIFTNGTTKYLYPNQSIEELHSHPDLRAAIYLPENLITQLPVLSKIVLTVFKNDAIFQTPTSYQQELNVASLIISMSVPNVDTTELTQPIPIFFKHNNDNQTNNSSCGYWVRDNLRTWVSDGLTLVAQTDSIMQFNASHLTNFALLIHADLQIDPYTDRVLALITAIGCSLSLLGILGIYTTAIRFAVWRQKASNQLLLQLSLAVALMLVIFFIVGTNSGNHLVWLCITMGAVLHYLVLVTFMWMLVMAYLQFMRYVVVFIRIRSDHYVLKLSCFSWILPTLPVIVVLAIDPQLYVPEINESAEFTDSICYPRGLALLLTVVVPIALIILCNLLIFAMVIYNIMKIERANRSIVMAQLRISVFLFFLMGLTWIFGLLAQAESFGLVFLYIFCATATLQGFVLFVYFVVLEPATRKLWAKDVKNACGMGRRGSMSVDVITNSRQTGIVNLN